MIKGVQAATGWSEVRLAQELGTTQATVNRLARGQVAEPLYSLGRRIEALWVLKTSQDSVSEAV